MQVVGDDGDPDADEGNTVVEVGDEDGDASSLDYTYTVLLPDARRWEVAPHKSRARVVEVRKDIPSVEASAAGDVHHRRYWFPWLDYMARQLMTNPTIATVLVVFATALYPFAASFELVALQLVPISGKNREKEKIL